MKLTLLVIWIAILAGCANNHSIEPTLEHSKGSLQGQCANVRLNLVAVDGNKQLERSGCCSWHGGVCGCSDGRAVCCDGKLSPTCGC